MIESQIPLLIDGLVHTIRVFGWVIGLSVTVFIASLGGALGIIFRGQSKRIDEAVQLANAARQCAAEGSKNANQMTAHCMEMRAACREQVFGAYVEKGEIKEMEQEFKELVQSMVSQLNDNMSKDRKEIIEKIDDLKASQETFKNGIWDALHTHGHADSGLVVRMDTTKKL